MFVKAIKTAKKAMFPIFRLEHVSQTQIKLLVVGSGFFINRCGHFITVSHIFDNPNQQTSFRYWGQLPEQVINPPLIINEVDRNDDFDIFIGRVDISSPGFFWFSKHKPDIGRSVCISGFPLAQIGMNPQGGPDLGGVRRYFQPSFVLDHAVMRSDNGFGRIRTHDGFLVRDLGLFGMSGGPIFNVSGKVVGMQGSVTQPRVSSGGGGRSISVENALAIRSELMLSLLTKNRIQYNFI